MAEPPLKKVKTDSKEGTGGTPDGTVLYSYWRSSCSWRVRIALNLKTVDYEYKAVHLLNDGGQQLKPEYAALNPMKELPTLCIDGVTLTQSVAILEYLEETRPSVPLLPSDPAGKAKVRAMVQAIASDIQPVQNLRVLLKVMEKDPSGKLPWGRHWIANGFDALEQMVRTTAGTCCYGDEVTFADLCLVPQIYNARRFQVDMSKYPTLLRIEAHLNTLPAFVKAHPDQQPDAVKS